MQEEGCAPTSLLLDSWNNHDKSSVKFVLTPIYTSSKCGSSDGRNDNEIKIDNKWITYDTRVTSLRHNHALYPSSIASTRSQDSAIRMFPVNRNNELTTPPTKSCKHERKLSWRSSSRSVGPRFIDSIARLAADRLPIYAPLPHSFCGKQALYHIHQDLSVIGRMIHPYSARLKP